MAKNSRRVAVALQSLVADLNELDGMPALKSLVVTIFFDSNGDTCEVTPRYKKHLKPANLTAEPTSP